VISLTDHEEEIRRPAFRKSANHPVQRCKTHLRKENQKKATRQTVQLKDQESFSESGAVETGLSETQTEFEDSSCEHSFQEPANKTPNLVQTPAAAWSSSHDALAPPTEMHGP
jgi:hypothetical protein